MKILTIAITFCVMLWPDIVSAIDLPKFVAETQRLEQESQKFRLVWWVPLEYWQESLGQSPALTDEQRKGLLDAVDDFIVIAVIDAEIGPLGSIEAKSERQMTDSILVSVNGAWPRRPLDPAELPQETQNLFAMMKPLMANMLGQFGRGLQFFLFDTPKDSQAPDIYSKGSLAVTLFDRKYEWRLPLGSVLPAKCDPQTGEVFPGNYNFNPFTGKDLTTSCVQQARGANGGPAAASATPQETPP